MNFLLKIVEGPNRGAEIALVEGVAVALGKGDGCDIILADPTLPDVPLNIEASADSVSADGERLEPFVVKTLGATSFAVGPADAPWGELKWPEKAESREPEAEGDGHEPAETPGEGNGTADAPGSEAKEEEPAPDEPRRRHGCLGCLVVLLLLVLLAAALCWFFRDEVSPYAEKARPYAEKAMSYAEKAWNGVVGHASSDAQPQAAQQPTIASIAEKYGLELSDDGGAAKLSGNFRTRRERLAATAEAYETRPGVELDLSDDESFKAAAEDALFTITEGALTVVCATNRYLHLAGASNSPFMLQKTLKQLNTDLPKLRGCDASGVKMSALAGSPASEEAPADGAATPAATFGRKAARRASGPDLTTLPVCGILTKPYPCLVMHDGRRVLEGAAFGGGVILEIGADEVVITNSTGRFTWRP